MRGTRLLELTTADSAGGRGRGGEGRGGEGKGEGGELKVMLLICTCVVYVQCESVVPYISLVVPRM